MPTDGLTRYDHLSGKDLLLELESMDRRRFPKNYESLRQEISSRGPVGMPVLGEHQVERYEALSHEERARFRWACVRRIGILLLQYQIFGGFVAAILGEVVSRVADAVTGSDHPSLAKNLAFALLFLLTIASYWSFLRWMLREEVSDMRVAIIRPRSLQAVEADGAPAAVSPNNQMRQSGSP
jgi:hypothetical protein